MSLRYLGGFITASYNPLKVPNPPTIGTVTPGNAQVSVAFTAPSNVGGSAITSFTVLVTDSSSGATFSNTGAASPIVVTGLTNGNTYTAKVLAVNSYGPSAFSAPSGSFSPVAYGLYSWGFNNKGQLGQNDIISRSSPVQVGSLSTWSIISSGSSYFSSSIKTDGTLWTWGYNFSGELGQNKTIYKSSPVQVGALTDWSKVSAASDFCVSSKTGNTIWSWGTNSLGQLGQSNTTNRSSPVQIGALTDWSQISAGGAVCAAIKTGGTLWTWGYNSSNGVLGINLGYGNNRSSPTQVGALTDWSKVSMGGQNCSAIKTGGTLWTWGRNNAGQLGQNNTTYRSSPVQVGALTNWSEVSSGQFECIAIKTDGTLWAWGDNQKGALGQNNIIDQSSPVQVGALTTWSKVSTRKRSCFAIKTDGTLWAWGYNVAGGLGLNNASNVSSPIQVGTLTNWSQVSAGSTFTIGILS